MGAGSLLGRTVLAGNTVPWRVCLLFKHGEIEYLDIINRPGGLLPDTPFIKDIQAISFAVGGKRSPVLAATLFRESERPPSSVEANSWGL